MDCGTRRGELPSAVAAHLATLRDRDRGRNAAAAAVPPTPARGDAGEGSDEKVAGGATSGATAAGTTGVATGATAGPTPAGTAAGWAALLAYFPSPRAAAALVICLIGLGTIIGTATSQVARSAGIETIIVDIAAKKPPPPEPEPEPEEPEVEEIPEAPEEAPAIVAVPEEPLPEEPLEEPLPEEPLPEEPAGEELPLPEEFNPEETEELPPVKHVWMIVLGENGYDETFSPNATAAPYLSKTLPEQGELLTNYYAVTTGKLANQVGLLSGQGPTPETVAECPPTETSPLPTDIVPGTISPETGQVEGNGCLYPKGVETLPGQLAAAKLKWKVYLQEVVPGTPEAKSCPRPFALFHSIADTPECLAAESPLSKLAKDLKAAKRTPTFSYIVPNACSAGAVVPCTPEIPPGPAAAETFLKEVVPEIVKSKAYSEGGLLIITSAQAPKVEPAVPDLSSCCATPAYPNLPPLPEEPLTGPVKATGGGGHVGLLLLSNFVKPGTVNETTYANHFTLLLTLEELFELEKLGYANEPALLPFDSTVFNYLEGAEESTGPGAEESTGPKQSSVKK